MWSEKRSSGDETDRCSHDEDWKEQITDKKLNDSQKRLVRQVLQVQWKSAQAVEQGSRVHGLVEHSQGDRDSRQDDCHFRAEPHPPSVNDCGRPQSSVGSAQTFGTSIICDGGEEHLTIGFAPRFGIEAQETLKSFVFDWHVDPLLIKAFSVCELTRRVLTG